jgi:hypothetical protein
VGNEIVGTVQQVDDDQRPEEYAEQRQGPQVETEDFIPRLTGPAHTADAPSLTQSSAMQIAIEQNR